jgi:two-component system cell cycle sensor histidine kinase/response regulator CckA
MMGAVVKQKRWKTPPDRYPFAQQMAGLSYGIDLCFIYQNEVERSAAIVQFIKDGLKRNERCVCMADDQTAHEFCLALAEAGIDVERERQRSGFSIIAEQFDPDARIHLLRSATRAALSSGFVGFRWIEDMSWASGTQQGRDLHRLYSTQTNAVYQSSRSLGLSLYDRWRTAPSILSDALRSHRIIAVDNRVYANNPYCETQPDRERVEAMLAQLDHSPTLTRKAAKANLAELLKQLSEQRVRMDAVLQQMPIAIIIAEAPSGRLILSNDHVEKIWGRPFVAATGIEQYRQWKGFHADGRPYEPGEWPLSRSIGTGEVVTAENIEIERADGTRRTLSASSSPVRNQNADVVGASMTFSDVTDNQRADSEREELLARVESDRGHLEAILRQMPAGVLIAEAPSGKILLSNEQLAKIWKAPASEMEEYRECRGFHADGRPYAAAEWPLARSIQSGEIVTDEEMEFVAGDGSRRAMIVRSAPIRDRNGAIVAGVAMFCDITEHKTLECQLRQAQKLEAIGRLAGGVAHDFNNLLFVITGYAQMLLDGAPDGNPLRTETEQVLNAAQRAAALTKQLLAFSRHQIIQPKNIDLNPLVAGLEKMLRRVIGEDIELKTVFAASLGRVKADPSQIEQVLLNLVMNARDAMPHGGSIVIETADVELNTAAIRKHLDLAPGHYTMLSVSDNGAGMDALTQDHLFEPFFSTKPLGKGTGLGLSTVYGIVKQSGGDISVFSRAAKGSTFTIYLPRIEETGDSAPLVIPENGTQRRGTENILLVEDDASVREVAREMLSGQGYQVLEAADGQQALQQFERCQGSIDVLLTDLIMPHMSGQELAQRMKLKRPGLKVIYMSGYTEDMITAHGALTDHVVFLEKPFSAETLQRKVRQILSESAVPATQNGSTLTPPNGRPGGTSISNSSRKTQ